MPDGHLSDGLWAEEDSDWRPFVALPPGHPLRAQLATLRTLTDVQSVGELLHISCRVRPDGHSMEQTFRLLSRPLVSVWHEPPRIVLVPRGSRVSSVQSSAVMHLADPVPVDERHDMVLVSLRRSSATRVGRPVLTEATFLIEAPQLIRHVCTSLRAPVRLFTFDVTLDNAPANSVELSLRPNWTSPPEVSELQPGCHLQFTTADARPGIAEFDWT